MNTKTDVNKGSAASHCSTARAVVGFQQQVRDMLEKMDAAFPVGSEVICDIFRGKKRFRVVAKVSLHQYTPGERMTGGLNVELEDWQVDALKIHPLLISRTCGKNVFEVPWDCVAINAKDSIPISP